jgi:hypothetical protein
MSVVPQDIHNVAASLSGGSDEACWRSSLSRSYYSVFHACALWHAQLPLPGSQGAGGGSHQRLCSQLRNPGVSGDAALVHKSKTLGMQLDALRVRRKVADYDIAETVDQAEALSISQLAGTILKKTETFP